MRRIRWSFVLLGLSLAATPAPAQGYVFTNPYGYDYGISGASVTYSRHRHHSNLSISFGGFAVSGYGFVPICRSFPLAYFVPPPLYGPVVNQQITVITYRPAPAPILVPTGPFILDDLTLAILPRREPEIPLNPRPLPERKAPVPNPPDPPRKPMQPEQAPAPRPEPPKQPPPKPPEMPRIPHPNPEPRGENARLIELGKESFADTEYGLAAQRFRQATVVLRNDPQAHFLLAQALFALGKYQDAVDALNDGMTLEPNWPAMNFRPLDLYGVHVALYPDHLRRLEDVVARFEKDPVVLFLFGYQLWFDGRKEDARDLFRKALPAGADPIVIDRFLRALPPGGGI